MVDAYYGPPDLAAEVDAEPPVDPRALVDDAAELLAALEDGWLRDQVAGLWTNARALSGEAMAYADEVEGCYGVRPTLTDEEAFATAHERLEELLAGDGPLPERYQRWQASIRVPPQQLEHTLAAVIEEARAWTRGLVELPDGEGVVLEIVHDKPWLAFCGYRGDFRSTIEVNVDLPISGFEAVVLASHETYPGHHVERCCKEDALVHGRGLLEETIVMVPTPQSLVSEGIAGLAPHMLLDGDGGETIAAVTRSAGIELDVGHALAVQRALEPCARADVNAALMLHDEGAGEAEVHAYLERWGLMSSQEAAHVIRFLEERSSRTYILTYSAGRELCRSYVADAPERFRRLLTEQVRVGDLLDAREARAPISSGA
jgi:hypothetical protein